MTEGEAGPQLVKVERNLLGRDLVVGDIHGCFADLQIALDAISFAPAVDRLFCSGDIIDRGLESHLVVDWLDKPWFFPVLGNHDVMAYQFAMGYPGALSDLREVGGRWLMDLPKPEQVRIGNRLRALPLAIQIETADGPVGIVHADFPSDDWQSISTPFSEGDRQICLWSTMRFDRVYRTEVRNVRALIHGHVTLPTARKLGNVFFFDTGGWMAGKGHFTFVELQSLDLVRGPGLTASSRSRRNR